MDQLIVDHEKRLRFFKGKNVINDFNDININADRNANTYLMHKLLAITISVIAAVATRVSWLDKARKIFKAIGIDKVKIDKSKIITFLQNIGRRKKVIVPEIVVTPKYSNFIPKLLITLVIGSGLGIGIHHNQEYLKEEVKIIGDKVRSLQLHEKLAFLELPEKFDQSKVFLDKLATHTNSQLQKGLKHVNNNLNKGFKDANKGINLGIIKTIDTGKKISTKLQEISSSSISTLSDVSTSVSSSLSTSLHEVVNEGKVIIDNIESKRKEIFNKLTTKNPQTSRVKSIMFAELTKDGDSSIRATFVNGNGNTLAARLWEQKASTGTMRPFVVFLHGIGAHVNRVPRNESGFVLGDEYVANFFLKSGFNFYSFDMEGHGFSQGERIYIYDWKTFMSDAEQFLELVKRRSPKGTPYFLMGESFGGALSVALGQKLWGINDQNINIFKDFKGVLLIAPAISVEMPSPIIVFILRYLLAPIIPKHSPFFMPQPLSKEKIWEDKSVGDWCIEEDTLGNGREKLKLRTALQVVLLMEYVQNMIKAGKVSFPWAIVQADKDLVTPIEGAMLLHNYSIPYMEATKKDSTRRNANKMLTIRAGYHDLLTSKQSDLILNFLTRWANERLVTFYEKLNKIKDI